VASLEPAEQVRYLEAAEREGWSRRELRANHPPRWRVIVWLPVAGW
jgi:hypothetical protein